MNPMVNVTGGLGYFLLPVGGAMTMTANWPVNVSMVQAWTPNNHENIWGRSGRVHWSYNNFSFHGKTSKLAASPGQQ